MKYILIIAILLTGCSTQYVTKKEMEVLTQKIDQNFQNQGGKIQILIEKVYAPEMAKGKAANCKQGFNFTNGLCLEPK